MRILHLDTGRELRGGQYQLLMLISGLEKLGAEQTLLARGRMLNCHSGRELTLTSLRRAAREADIIHAHDAKSHSLAALFCRNRPLIVSRRVAFTPRPGILSRWKYRQPRHYIAVSRYVRRRLLDAGVWGEKITVVFDAVDGRHLAGEPSRLSSPPLGRAIKVVAPKLHDPLKAPALLRRACAKAQADLVFSADLEGDLLSADIFAYLSYSEGLGSAILLAMALGVPVVASREGGIPELIEHERTGLLTENEPAAVAEAIRRLGEDRALASSCAAAARQRVSSLFRDDIMVRQTQQVYEEILAQNAQS